jgi:hypothetical protein
MEETDDLRRNEKGDIEFHLSDEDRERLRRSRYTYIFHYYDEKKEHYFPYFGLISSADRRLENARQDPDFFEKQLYWTPDEPPYDFFIWHHNRQLGMLVEFFKEVFEEQAFIEGYQPSHKYYRVILPKQKYNEIINCINEFGLLPIRDLLFEVIATAQHKYVEHIAFWEKPDMQKLVTSAAEQTRKAIALLEKLDVTAWERGEPGAKPPSELRHINFAFNDGTIKIEHAWLAREFIDHFKRYYDDLPYKNWRVDLARYPDRFEDNIRQQQFKYMLAKSLYNLLTKIGAFKVSKQEPTPNKLMLCIAKLLEFCMIPVAAPDEIDEIKVKKIRNWLKRKELQPALTYADLPANKEKLLKYFEPELINITKDIKGADAISVAFYLGKRFSIDHLVPDLAHLAQALKEVGWLIGHQMFGDQRPFEPQFEEFSAFSRLVNGVREKKKMASFTYKLEGDDREYELTQRLPLYLLEESIKAYAEDNQVEFDTDPVRTQVTRTTEGGLKVDKEDHFAQPEERFMVRFVAAFYQYLRIEAPPGNHDSMPSEKYYAIIANMLEGTWFFYRQHLPEEFLVSKVKQWHDLSLRK